MKKKYKKYPMGGMLKGASHEEGGIPIEAEGNEILINTSMNGAAQKHEDELLALNENPDDYEIIPKSNAMDRSEVFAMGGGMVDKMYEKGGKIPSAHKDHHSKKHIKAMEIDMKEGDSFKKAHNKALKKVGK